MAGDEQLLRLYRDSVLEHSRNPHNFRRIANPEASAEGHNPLCGDKITLYLQLDTTRDQAPAGAPSPIRISDAAFEATGCAISLASASMLTDMVTGHSADTALALSRDVQDMLAGKPVSSPLGPLDALAGVQAYPSRVRCAALPWRTLEAALNGSRNTVTTEPGAN